ncbi:hypothetical protein EhV18_00312 [Emiliania huxleyi virus 18]|nr:hypothetical protein EhV18_00312 [Emiliania huxleyi virus 18]AHA55397.1 hypothetical protein EhV156_00302 [Emiliania huxleyi virus 156]
MSVGANVGVSIAVTVLLIFAAVILYKWVKRNRYKMPFNYYTSESGEDNRYPNRDQYEAFQRGAENAKRTISRIRSYKDTKVFEGRKMQAGQ